MRNFDDPSYLCKQHFYAPTPVITNLAQNEFKLMTYSLNRAMIQGETACVSLLQAEYQMRVCIQRHLG